MHLLTAEAADIYRKRLAPGGLLLFHISNRSLNLEPVTRGLAQHLNWNAAQILAEDNPSTGEDGSRWVILTGESGATAEDRSSRAARRLDRAESQADSVDGRFRQSLARPEVVNLLHALGDQIFHEHVRQSSA